MLQARRERHVDSLIKYDVPFREFRTIAPTVPIRRPWSTQTRILHIELTLRRAERAKVCRFFGMSRIECQTCGNYRDGGVAAVTGSVTSSPNWQNARPAKAWDM